MPSRLPLQLFAGLHYLVLSGRACWDDTPAALRDEQAFLGEWLATERVQTNEVGRCWWLLPCFLEAGRRCGAQVLDLVELGCSGGLNLAWDRYGYSYANGTHPGEPALTGTEKAVVPRELLARRPAVRSRVGVDLAPPDLRTDDGVRYVKAFVWADQAHRIGLLDRAVEAWRTDPPEIVVGDMVEELPALLERRREGALMLVWQTASLNYLPKERRARVRELLAAAGEEGPLAFVETWKPLDDSDDYYGLYVQTWPGGERVEVAHGEFHGAWLEWLA